MGKAKELSIAAREGIARKLFTVKEHLAGRNELHGLCPFHDDSNPSFGYNYEKDQFHCFTCSAGGDLIKLWSHVRGTGNEADDFKAFCKEYGLPLTGSGKEGTLREADPPTHTPDNLNDSGKDKKIPQSVLTLAWEKMEPLPSTWMKRLSASRGWSEAAMQQLSLRIQTCRWDKRDGSLVDIKNPDRVAIPVFDADGVVKNIRCYKPGAKVKIFSFGPGCGDARLFPAVPSADGVVLLVEGEGDTICAISNGFNAITQTSKTKYWSDEHLEPFNGRDVVVAYDADQPGQKYATYAATSLLRVAQSVRVLAWPDFMGRRDDGTWPEDHGQDLTDFFVNHKKGGDDLKSLMAMAPEFTRNDAGLACDVMRYFDHGPNGRYSYKGRLLANNVIEIVDIKDDPETGILHKWNDICWEPYPEEYLEKLCIDLLGDEAQQSRVKDAVFQAKRLSVIPHGRKFNDQTDWVCMKNGMLNLWTLELRPHSKEFYANRYLPFDWDPQPGKTCERWLQFQDESIQTEGPKMQSQEFFGYCMVPDTCHEKALVAIGDGGEGKSVWLNMLEACVGKENCSAVAFQDLDDQFHRSALYGKLLNISTELGSKALESQFFKAIVSGDPISAAFKHKDAFHFRPTCKLAFACNRMPRILDNSDGVFRRLLPIRFKRQFLHDADPGLKDKLMEELPQIFEWALAGLHRLRGQGGFTDCEETRELLMEHRRANNPVLCFIEEECLVGAAESAAKSELYKRYRGYCNASGYSAMGKENFFREMYASIANIKQFRPRKNNPARQYYVSGVSLIQN